MNKILGTALNPIGAIARRVGGDAEKYIDPASAYREDDKKVKAARAAAAASTVKTYKHGGKVSARPGKSRKFV